jgi:hypothetical protein
MFTTTQDQEDKTMTANGKPPKGVYSPYEVVKVLPGKPVKFISVVSQWEDVHTHWYGRHSVKCPGAEKCELCKVRNAVAWKGYLLGTAPSGGAVAIFQITPLGFQSLEEASETPGGLLGAVILLTRQGKRENSPLTAELKGWVSGQTLIPYETLQRTVNVLYREYAAIDLFKPA